MIDTG